MRLFHHTEAGTFLSRPNRFIARVERAGREETVHVKNTGRCRELLVPGARVVLSRAENPGRKTGWDLVAVWKGDTLVNMDAQAPNEAAGPLLGRLFPEAVQRREFVWGDSRFDYCLETGERRILVEVKGVTLERDGVALFPDAPTARGTKHLRELAAARKEGWAAYLLFLNQLKGCREFLPNEETDGAFAEALRAAARAGVGVLCYDCAVTENGMEADAPVPVRL